MKLKIALYFYFVINLLMFIPLANKFSVYSSINKEECEIVLRPYFIEAMLLEIEKRLIDNNIPHMSYDKPNHTKPKDALLIRGGDTTRVKRTKEYEAIPLEEKRARIAQTAMARHKDYLQVNDLDSIWNAILKQENIFLETGVKYRYRNEPETVYSNKDSHFFKTAACLDEYVTGFEGEISLHGYYKITFSTLYHYSERKFNVLFLIGFGLLVSLIGCFILIQKYTRIKLTPLIQPEEEPEYLRIKKSSCYLICDHIILDVERSLLWAQDGREAMLTPKMVEFFEEMLRSGFYHALNVDLWKKVWKTKEDTSNVLTQLVSNLRDEIKMFPELEIRNIPKKGYQLIIHHHLIPKENEESEL